MAAASAAPVKATRSVDDGAKAQALLEGKEPGKEVQKPAAAGRFVVQVASSWNVPA